MHFGSGGENTRVSSFSAFLLFICLCVDLRIIAMRRMYMSPVCQFSRPVL